MYFSAFSYSEGYQFQHYHVPVVHTDYLVCIRKPQHSDKRVVLSKQSIDEYSGGPKLNKIVLQYPGWQYIFV